jgi:putative cell wall-binding protein
MASSGNRRRPLRPPATTPEAREQQLIAAAYELAERQISEGKASSQVLTHFLKMGTERERLEQQRLQHENALTLAKVESLATQGRIEQLYSEALAAMRRYSGHPDEVIEE